MFKETWKNEDNKPEGSAWKKLTIDPKKTKLDLEKIRKEKETQTIEQPEKVEVETAIEEKPTTNWKNLAEFFKNRKN